MTGHRSALPPRYFITLRHQPTTRACQVLRYNITGKRAWWAMWSCPRKCQATMTRSHAAMTCGQCGQSKTNSPHDPQAWAWGMGAGSLWVMWAMWSSIFFCWRSTLCTPYAFMRIKLRNPRFRRLHDHFAHMSICPCIYREKAWAIRPHFHYPTTTHTTTHIYVRKCFTSVSGYGLLHLWVN